MKTLKKITLIASISAVFVVLLAYAALKTGVLTGTIKAAAEAEAKKATGKEISVGRVELGIYNTVTLRDVVIPVGKTVREKGVMAEIGGIILRFSLKDIITGKKNIFEALSTVIIDSPKIIIEKSGGTLNAYYFPESFGNTGGASAAGQVLPDIKLPVSKLLIENGRVIYNDMDSGASAEVSMIKGSIGFNIKSKVIKCFLSGKTRPSLKRDLSVGGEYYLDSGNFTASASGKNSDIAYFVSLFTKKISSAPYEIASGKFSFNINFSGNLENIADIKASGDLSVRDATLMFNKLSEISGISGDIKLDNYKAELTGLDFVFLGGKGRVKGAAYDILKSPRFEVVARLDEMDLSRINSDISGKMSVISDISGNTASFKAGGELKADNASFLGVPAEKLRAVFGYADNKFDVSSLSGFVMGGVIEGKAGAVTGNGGNISGNFSIKNADFSKASFGRNTTGIFDINMKIYGKTETPRFEFSASSSGIKTGGYSFNDLKLTGLYYMGSGYASINAFYGFGAYSKLALNAEAEIKKEEFILKKFNVSEGAKEIIYAEGNLSKGGGIDFKARAKDIEIEKIMIPQLEGKKISGVLNVKADFLGTVKSPVMELSLNSPGLYIRENKYRFSAGINIKDEILKITGLNLSDALRASVNYSFKKKIFEFFADFKDFNGDVLAESTGMEWLSGSSINGNAVFRKTGGGYGGRAEITGIYQKGLYRNFQIKTFGENGRFDIQRVIVNQDKGRLDASGSFAFKSDTDITLDAKGVMTGYRIGEGAVIDCIFSTAANAFIKEHGIDSYTRMKASGLKINGKSEGDLDTSLKTEKDLYEIRVSIGESYNGLIKYAGGEEKSVDADIKLKDADLNPVFAALGIKRNPLPKGSEIRAAFKLKGPVETALLTADILQNQGLIKAHGKVSFKPGAKNEKKLGASIKYDVANMSLKDFGMIADPNFAGQGRVSGSGEFALSEGRLKLKGDMLAKTGRIAGIDYDDIIGEYIFDNKRFTLRKMIVNHRKTLMDLSGSYVESRRKSEYDMFISSYFKNFKIQGNLLNGSARFFGRLGTGKNNVLNGTLESEDFAFKNHRFKPFKLKIEDGPESFSIASLKGESVVTLRMDKDGGSATIKEATIKRNGVLMLAATGYIKKNGEMLLEFDGTGIDPQLVDELMGWGHTWKGSLDGNVKVTAVKGKPPSMVIAVNIKNGNVDGLDFDLADMLVTLSDDWLNLSPVSPLLIAKNKLYDINITGKVPVPLTEESAEKLKGAPMDVKISIKEGDLSIIKILGFIEDASGPVNAQLRMTGTKEFPSLSGKIDVTDGTVKLKYLFRELKHVYANFLISDNIVDIYDFKGDTERGTIKIENLNEKKGGVMKFMKLSEFNWKITSMGDSIRFTDTPYLEFLRGDADINLALTGPVDSPYLQGSIHVHDFTYLFPAKNKSKDGTEALIKEEDNFANKIIWDLAVTGGENVRYYSNYLNNYADIIIAPWKQPLKIQDKANSLKINGNLRIKRGTYKYMNAEFLVDDLKESKIVFDGDKRPVLDAYANTRFRRFKRYESPDTPIDLTVKLRVWGRVGDLKLDLSSDPPLGLNERDRLLYIMTFGSDINPGSSEFRAEDAAKLADAVASFWIKKGTEQLIGYTPFDVLNIKVDVSKFMQANEPQKQATPQADSSLNTLNASRAEKAEAPIRAEIDMGKYLTDSLYVGYNIKLLDVSSILPKETLDFKHTLEFEFSFNEMNKLKAYKTFVNPMLGTEELFLGLETRWTFESWGMKEKKEK